MISSSSIGKCCKVTGRFLGLVLSRNNSLLCFFIVICLRDGIEFRMSSLSPLAALTIGSTGLGYAIEGTAPAPIGATLGSFAIDEDEVMLGYAYYTAFD